ncbi:MAG: tyrosine--tRNA ligase [Propionibacteriaceae bacterium]|uniref:Tyrosine--tRNA ligase n=1 Tax=Propionibacterium ruminifibrarum TaxID=1962131 RepID=A0A375I4R8_9ACTN|nr:tyrosine--tRNA ligase [Propionibacterium ruminifibrarum]MBE6478719.1 tyrosine--tRNA ligase [Propionibacteriaceae bacterium]SPF69170.1 Tyrosine-tRNA ligase [Propionibacterium ruminifibrarum]
MNALLDDLTWRGFISTTTDQAALAAHLDEGMVTSYVGFDPTAPSLHIGHLMQLILARRLQQAGHRPLLLVGGATGLIGDPKMTGERVMNTKETVAAWVESLRAQVSRFVSFEGENASQVVNNLDWTASLSALDFLRDIGKHFSVNRMLARDVVARRLNEGISYTEFSYVLLQSLDYAALHERYGCTLQTGAQDQWGNITAGIDYIRRTTGDVVHGLVTPLLTKTDGTKFGKTEGGAVWIDPERTSPYAFHQFWLNAEDAKVIDYLKIFSDRTRDEIDDLAAQTREAPAKRAAQRALANDVTDLVHGVEARRSAEDAAAALFGRGDLRALDERTLTAVMTEVGAAELPRDDGRLPLVVDALVASGAVPSKSAARRAIAEGGAYLNNQKVTDTEARLDEDDLLAGRYALVRRGKRTVGGVILP